MYRKRWGRPGPGALRGFVLVSLGLLLSGCASTGSEPGRDPAAQPAPSAGTVVDGPLDPAVLTLPLVDEHGRRTSLGALAGKTIVLTDFLTTCSEICPLTSANFRNAAQAVLDAGLGDTVTFVEITIDPERDDPTRLAAYQNLYGGALPDWDLMTAGTAGTATLWRSLGVGYQKTALDDPPPKDWMTGKPLTYDVAHQDVVLVIDAKGHERWLIAGAPSLGAGQTLPSVLTPSLNDQTGSDAPVWGVKDLEAAVSYVTGHHVG